MRITFLSWLVLILIGLTSCQQKQEEKLVTIIDDSKFEIQFDSLKLVFNTKLNGLGNRKIEKYSVFNLSGDLIQEVGFRYNGKVSYISNYKNGTEDGRRYSFYPTGIIQGEFEFKDGIFTGRGREYDRNGIQVFTHSKINGSDTFDLAILKNNNFPKIKYSITK